MGVPKNLLYSEDHEWILVEGSEAKIGITDFAQHELGDVVFVELPEVEEVFAQHDEFGVIESVKAVSDVYIPASGKVIAINENLVNQPELVNEEPYKGGWLIKIKLTDKGELENLMNNERYEKYLEEEE